MLNAIRGICRDGKVELSENPPGGYEGSVIITFLEPSNELDLAAEGIGPEQAAELRHRLSTFAEDWSAPEMDDYDALPSR